MFLSSSFPLRLLAFGTLFCSTFLMSAEWKYEWSLPLAPEAEIEPLLTLEDGSTHRMDSQTIHKSWSNGNLLFNRLPNEESLRITAIEVPARPILQNMRVWAVE